MTRKQTYCIVAGLIAVQFAFGLWVKASTGSDLWPPLLKSWLIATGMWVAIPMAFAAYMVVKLDRESPTASAVQFIAAHRARILGPLGLLLLFATSFAAINWTKAMIPGFSADQALANLDHAIFGTDPWKLFDIAPLRSIMALSYAFWFPIIYGFMLLAHYSRNVTAILSVFLIAAIDTFAQFILPSAGPIFWQRLGYGDRFAELASGPDTYVFFSDLLWSHHASGTVDAGTGISAMPSMHVALSFWLLLCFPMLRAFTLPFFAIVYAASVASGWHYFTDGIAGCAMAFAAYKAVTLRQAVPERPGGLLIRSKS